MLILCLIQDTKLPRPVAPLDLRKMSRDRIDYLWSRGSYSKHSLYDQTRLHTKFGAFVQPVPIILVRDSTKAFKGKSYVFTGKSSSFKGKKCLEPRIGAEIETHHFLNIVHYYSRFG